MRSVLDSQHFIESLKAYHEAGHIVSAVLSGYTVDSVDMTKPQVTVTGTNEDPIARVGYVVAGVSAHYLYYHGKEPLMACWMSATGDYEKAKELVLEKCPHYAQWGAYDAEIKKLEKNTRQLLKGNWPMVERVADYIMGRETVSGEEIHGLFK